MRGQSGDRRWARACVTVSRKRADRAKPRPARRACLSGVKPTVRRSAAGSSTRAGMRALVSARKDRGQRNSRDRVAPSTLTIASPTSPCRRPRWQGRARHSRRRSRRSLLRWGPPSKGSIMSWYLKPVPPGILRAAVRRSPRRRRPRSARTAWGDPRGSSEVMNSRDRWQSGPPATMLMSAARGPPELVALSR